MKNAFNIGAISDSKISQATKGYLLNTNYLIVIDKKQIIDKTYI